MKSEDTDAQLAARLQAQENRSGRATRGGGVKRVKKAAVKKRKSKAKVGADEDSEMEVGSDGVRREKAVKERKGGFHVSASRSPAPQRVMMFLRATTTDAAPPAQQKKYALSEQLSALVGETQETRPQTVKKIWNYIKAHDLQDPADKRQIRCDDVMQAVFRQDQVHMFTMNKLLGKHLYPLDESDVAVSKVETDGEA